MLVIMLSSETFIAASAIVSARRPTEPFGSNFPRHDDAFYGDIGNHTATFASDEFVDVEVWFDRVFYESKIWNCSILKQISFNVRSRSGQKIQ